LKESSLHGAGTAVARGARGRDRASLGELLRYFDRGLLTTRMIRSPLRAVEGRLAVWKLMLDR